VAAADGRSFEADVVRQTLELSALGELEAGNRVNLEPAVRAGAPLGGHIVQGHVDGVAVVAEVEPDGNARRLRVELPAELEHYVVERGSVALDGVSLTVAGVTSAALEVALVPETLARTTLGERAVGDRLNLEVDVLARHVERLVQGLGAR